MSEVYGITRHCFTAQSVSARSSHGAGAGRARPKGRARACGSAAELVEHRVARGRELGNGCATTGEVEAERRQAEAFDDEGAA